MKTLTTTVWSNRTRTLIRALLRAHPDYATAMEITGYSSSGLTKVQLLELIDLLQLTVDVQCIIDWPDADNWIVTAPANSDEFNTVHVTPAEAIAIARRRSREGKGHWTPSFYGI